MYTYYYRRQRYGKMYMGYQDKVEKDVLRGLLRNQHSSPLSNMKKLKLLSDVGNRYLETIVKQLS